MIVDEDVENNDNKEKENESKSQKEINLVIRNEKENIQEKFNNIKDSPFNGVRDTKIIQDTSSNIVKDKEIIQSKSASDIKDTKSSEVSSSNSVKDTKNTWSIINSVKGIEIIKDSGLNDKIIISANDIKDTEIIKDTSCNIRDIDGTKSVENGLKVEEDVKIEDNPLNEATLLNNIRDTVSTIDIEDKLSDSMREMKVTERKEDKPSDTVKVVESLKVAIDLKKLEVTPSDNKKIQIKSILKNKNHPTHMRHLERLRIAEEKKAANMRKKKFRKKMPMKEHSDESTDEEDELNLPLTEEDKTIHMIETIEKLKKLNIIKNEIPISLIRDLKNPNYSKEKIIRITRKVTTVYDSMQLVQVIPNFKRCMTTKKIKDYGRMKLSMIEIPKSFYNKDVLKELAKNNSGYLNDKDMTRVRRKIKRKRRRRKKKKKKIEVTKINDTDDTTTKVIKQDVEGEPSSKKQKTEEPMMVTLTINDLNQEKIKEQEKYFKSGSTSTNIKGLEQIVGTKNMKCNYCSFSTNLELFLHKHIKYVHIKDKPFKCSHCEYSSNRDTNLKNHVNRCHSNSNFSCATCGFTTNYILKIKKHLLIHALMKRYKCNYCGYKTSISNNLKNHVSEKHLKLNKKLAEDYFKFVDKTKRVKKQICVKKKNCLSTR